MLAFQTMHTKRRRDDDSDSEDERYFKKSRHLNIRTNLPWAQNTNAFPNPSKASPPRLVPGLDAMTPAESEPSEANSPATIPEDHQIVLSPHGDIDYSMQMEEDEPDSIFIQPPHSPFVTNFRPAKLNFDLFNNREKAPDISARVPTPIYPSFNNANINNTGGMNGLGFPTGGLAGSISTTSHNNNFLATPSADSTLQIPHRRQRSQDRTIRMPSPISEDEDLPDTPTALTQSQLSRLSVANDRMDTEMGPPAVPARGRKRSGALTGIVGRFSMGYREDCEKCRLRVPGHYSHFL